MSKIKVAELFYSLQGEGRYMGIPSVLAWFALIWFDLVWLDLVCFGLIWSTLA